MEIQSVADKYLPSPVILSRFRSHNLRAAPVDKRYQKVPEGTEMTNIVLLIPRTTYKDLIPQDMPCHCTNNDDDNISIHCLKILDEVPT